MNVSSFRNRLLSVLMLGAISSCASTQKRLDSSAGTNEEKLTNEENAAAAELRTELDIGRAMTGRLLAAYGVDNTKITTEYISILGTYVAENSDWSSRKFFFAVTEDKSVSAYSCPGGYVLASKGAILLAQNEAELAAVLAHEISHVGRKHVINTIKTKSAKSSSLPKGSDPALEARLREQPDSDSKAGGALARYLSGPGGTSISVFAATSGGLTALLSEGLDKEMEFEADSDALRIMMKAGYDGGAYINYLSRINVKSSPNTSSVLDKTHPPLAERISRLVTLHNSLKNNFPQLAIGKERFLKMTSALRKNNEQKVQ